MVVSGSDYPVARPDQVLGDLRGGDAAAFMNIRPITRSPACAFDEHGSGFDHRGWLQLAYDRFVAKRLAYPWPTRRLHKNVYVRSPRLLWYLTPLGRAGIRPYGRDFWFTAHREALQVLTADTPLRRRLLAHFRHRMVLS